MSGNSYEKFKHVEETPKLCRNCDTCFEAGNDTFHSKLQLLGTPTSDPKLWRLSEALG